MELVDTKTIDMGQTQQGDPGGNINMYWFWDPEAGVNGQWVNDPVTVLLGSTIGLKAQGQCLSAYPQIMQLVLYFMRPDQTAFAVNSNPQTIQPGNVIEYDHRFAAEQVGTYVVKIELWAAIA